jgi:predicted phage tail protein
MLTRIKLLGNLGKRFVREITLDIESPAEAIRALGSLFDGFTAFMHSSDNHYRIVDGNPEGLDEEEIHLKHRQKIIVIAPIIAASGGFGKIILGVVLIGAAFLIPGGIFGISPLAMGLMGGALLLSGISEILSPKPKAKKTDSYGFGNTATLGQQGNPLGVAYGTIMIDSPIVIAAANRVDEFYATNINSPI